MEIDKQQAIEKYFLARGWKYYEFDPITLKQNYWSEKEYFSEKFESLPDIIDHYPSFKKHVLEVMMEDKYYLFTSPNEVQWKSNFNEKIYLSISIQTTKSHWPLFWRLRNIGREKMRKVHKTALTKIGAIKTVCGLPLDIWCTGNIKK